MDKMKVGTGDWVVVCDGRKALILENIGDSAQPAKTAARDAYAQLNVAEAKAPTAAAVEKPPARAMKSSETAARPADAKKRKVAKTHPGKPMILVAQQPHFGLFNSTW